MADLDDLVDEWLTLPAVAERCGVEVSAVRQMLRDGLLIGVRRGERQVLSVPARLLADDGPLPEMPGTVQVLADSGLDAEESLRWLFTPDDSIVGGCPVEALHAGHKTEVRRRAQALAI